MDARAGIADGLKVVEVGSSVSVAIAGMTLADAGAEVVLVEPPGGSALRRERAFAMWARGKQSEPVDLTTRGGRARLDALLAEADVLLLGLKAGSLERLALIPESLAAASPRLVVACVTGFGRGGPFRDVPAWDGVVQARGGRMFEFSTMAAGARPVFTAAPVASHGAAMALVTGVFSALRERLRNGGRGQVVETSLIRALTCYDLGGWIPGGPAPLRLEDAPFLPYSIARTKDGVWIQFAQNGPALFADFLRVLGLEGEIDYLESMSPATDAAKKRAHRELIQARIAERTWSEWGERFAPERNLSVEPFRPPGKALDHPQFQAIGDVVSLPGPDGGPTRQLGPIFDVPARPLVPGGPAPRLGTVPARFSATNGSCSAHGETPERIASEAGTLPGPGLLSGVIVLELGMWIALPYAATWLAELGARVIKLEPLEGDPMRATGPFSYKLVQGKQSLALDLKQPEAREIVHRLVARADVLLHSYRPGVPERLGIDFETLRAINPKIVHLYNGAYGSRGPKCDAPAFHVTGGAVAGGAWAQAGAGCPPPADVVPDAAERARISRRLELANEANPDFNSAVAAAAATAAGLYHRERTGEAIALETRMMLSNAMMMSADFVDDGRGDARCEVDADLHGLGPLYRLYPTAKGWIFLAAPRARDFERLCGALGLDAVARDARFATDEARAANAAALADVLGAAFTKREADELEASLTSRGVACVRADLGPCRRWLFEQDWARSEGLVVEAASSEIGPYLRYGAPVVNDRPVPLGGAFASGKDTRALLAELGYDERATASLFARRIVAEPRPKGATPA
ncbi:MAG: CoA transferase [Deltaproteobacteria bacterium]|nr:CoA transferase [Deltaproteobacteria bacterium]